MEGFSLIRDFAIIVVVAGAITLLFRALRQPPILGYILAGILVGPYALPQFTITDPHTISLLADLGLVLLLFGLGLEFSWSKIRQIGLAVLVIGVVEILTMMSLGYGLGQLLGWSKLDSIYLGATLHISSSAIIVKILRDLKKLDLVSSRLIVGILVVEDFAAVIIITLLSGMATTGMADLGDIGSLVLRLVVFVAASLTLGAIIVPRIIRFAYRFDSKEAILITCLGLCFAMALIGKYLGLSVAAGAFLMGALIGDTRHGEEITGLVAPIRDMFAAIFFVAIGMLIDVYQIEHFIVPALIVTAVFLLGKILSNTMMTFIMGHDRRTALEVGMGMPQMGEFSLAIAKQGIDRGIVSAPLYPMVATVAALTSLIAPYINRSSSYVAGFIERRSPRLLNEYASRLADWLQTIRAVFASDSEVARKIKHSLRLLLVNLLILIVTITVGSIVLDFVDRLADYTGIRADIVALIIALFVLVICIFAFVGIWRNLRVLVGNAAIQVFGQQQSKSKWSRASLRIVLRDSIVIVIAVFVALWFIPFAAGLISIGRFALVVPIMILLIIVSLASNSLRNIYREMERNFSRTIFGEEYTSEMGALPQVNRGKMSGVARKFKTRAQRIIRRKKTDVNK